MLDKRNWITLNITIHNMQLAQLGLQPTTFSSEFKYSTNWTTITQWPNCSNPPHGVLCEFNVLNSMQCLWLLEITHYSSENVLNIRVCTCIRENPCWRMEIDVIIEVPVILRTVHVCLLFVSFKDKEVVQGQQTLERWLTLSSRLIPKCWR